MEIDQNITWQEIRVILEEGRKLLPIQFPLGIFIHNNMLMCFEDREFEKAMDQATKVYGAKRTLSEKYYLGKYRRKRISDRYLKSFITDWLKENPGGLDFKKNEDINFFLKLIINPIELHLDDDFNTLKFSQNAEKSWMVWNDSLKKASAFIPDFERYPINPRKITNRKIWKDHLSLRFGERVNDYFHPIIIRFLASYMDQGMAVLSNPNTDSGALKDFLEFLYDNGRFLPKALIISKEEFVSLYKLSPEEFVMAEVQDILNLKIPLINSLGEKQNLSEYLQLTLLELRGWAGMVNKYEKEPHLIPRQNAQLTLQEYLGIYLFLENRVYKFLSNHYEMEGKWPTHGLISDENFIAFSQKQLAYVLFQTIEKRGDSFLNEEIEKQKKIIHQILKFDKFERAIIWQKAFDYSLRDDFINALLFSRKRKQLGDKKKCSAQLLFCIDDREEGPRRHLEEINPELETFGVVGFYGLDMRYKSIHHPMPLNHCPPVINPSRIILEKLVNSTENKEKMFGKKNKLLAKMALMLFYKTKSSWYSIFLTLILAPIFGTGLMLRIFAPLLANRFNNKIKKLLLGDLEVELDLSRKKNEAGEEIGYDFEERALIISKILKMCGLVDHFSPLVFLFGHGASSINNPYRNAYGCGACSGRSGFPNSKIFCQMANESAVRKILKEKYQITIPEDTFFISAGHDTTTDEIYFFNEKEIPHNKYSSYLKIKENIIEASKINALERSRNFDNKLLINNKEAAYIHAHSRASNMAEPRPEYGHTNNLGCFIGHRNTVKKLFFDRRSFLASYDYKIDPTGEILEAVLAGVIPVVAGINMDYYLSRLDNQKFGSGTKLPLNITSLIGVMTGGCSDLRIGLSKQMVEKHEPVRLTVAIEAPLERVKLLLAKNPRIKNIVYNNWVHLIVMDPSDLEKFYLLTEKEFRAIKIEGEFALPLNLITSHSIDVVKNRIGPLPYFIREREYHAAKAGQV